MAYSHAPKIGIVTAYFNPFKNPERYENYLLFIEPIRKSGVPHVVVECDCQGGGFQLPKSQNSLRIRGGSTLWQKERLVNLGVSHLSKECEHVLWVDCDLLFMNPNWILEASNMLQRCSLVQLFEEVYYLHRGAKTAGQGFSWYRSSFSRTYLDMGRKAISEGAAVASGGGWGASRRLFSNVGIYDRCVVGSNDYLMCNAAVSNWTLTPHGKNMAPFLLRDWRQWSELATEFLDGNIGVVQGKVLHLWHGTHKSRFYSDRYKILSDHDYDPAKDIRLSSEGAYEWASRKKAMHADVRSYLKGVARGE